ncbi:hypothetical protein AOC05_18110 [Arthrobacter alpinus]|uniref:Acyl-CoA oxidase/dehydrogenase middle domain-containing protein n=1 Tax=Arthrobacter alpinus TaxID=656366 RepID=A0A0M4QR02_9MICC|nr:hypothetical protein AOC05_18110 [Arthrobacter alpinus]
MTDLDGTDFLDGLHDAARDCGGRVPAILGLARELGPQLPFPGRGRTLGLWQALATLGAADLTAARIIEPHVDAVAILHQAGRSDIQTGDSTWGVFAAQGPGEQLLATETDRGWRLNGPKPWCSLAEDLSHALVTARAEDGMRLFAIELSHPGISTMGRAWTALGLPSVPSRGLSLVDVPAIAVGSPEWYVQRPGFSWGGIGVAAIWHGAATALARRVYRHCLSREPDQIALWHLGTLDQALWSSRVAFEAAAATVDRQSADSLEHGGGDAPALTAARLRAAVVSASETILTVSAHGMGPEPLAFEPEHAQRVADLELYLRQDHAERSLSAQGRSVFTTAGGGEPPW